jgi:hypothetical protein
MAAQHRLAAICLDVPETGADTAKRSRRQGERAAETLITPGAFDFESSFVRSPGFPWWRSLFSTGRPSLG